MEQDMSGYSSTMNSIDSQLRAAESNLQQDSLKALDSSDNLAASVGNVDKIRDILFGNQMRDYDKRFKRLEERFAKDNMHLRDDMAQRLKALEELLNSEMDNLGEKLKTDRQERINGQQELLQQVAALKSELNNRVAQLDEQFGRDLKQLRQQLHNKFQELSNQLRQQNDGLVGIVKQEVTQLQEEKVNRRDLAAFFNEFALRLNKDTSAED